MLRILFAALIVFALLTPTSAAPPSSGMRCRPSIPYLIATAYSVEGMIAALSIYASSRFKIDSVFPNIFMHYCAFL
jgi:hypothetical protein